MAYRLYLPCCKIQEEKACYSWETDAIVEMPEVPTTDSLLFGDGASATAIEIEAGNKLLYAQKTDGERYKYISVGLDGDLTMDGNAVLLFSLNEVCQSIREMRSHFDIQEESIDYYILHQAQKLIVDGIARECDMDMNKVLRSYEEYGNTSTATLPFTICNNAEKIKKKKRVRFYMLRLRRRTGLVQCGSGYGNRSYLPN